MDTGGLAVGAISLGIQACKGLVDYYQEWKGCHKDVDDALEKIQGLQINFGLLHDAIAGCGHSSNVLARVEACLSMCEEGVAKLQKKLDKIRAKSPPKPTGSVNTVRANLNRVLYPFKCSVIAKLKELVEDLQQQLSQAMQILNLTEVSHIKASINEANVGVTKLLTYDEQRQLDSAIAWLAAPDPVTNHEEAREKHEKGTGKWFIQSEDYILWKAGTIRFLWLNGKAGCCKTVLCSTIIEDIKSRLAVDGKVAFAYFYLSFADKQKQNYAGFLSSILSQLSRRSSLNLQLREAQQANDRSICTLERMFETLTQSSEKIYIFLDAVDESPQADDQRRKLMEGVARLISLAENTQWFFTSRPEKDIQHYMDELNAMRVPIDDIGVNTDIRLYVEGEIARDLKLKSLSDSMKAQIQDAFNEKAGGMFRWAFCQLEQIKGVPLFTPKYLTAALADMPRTLDKTYERIISGFGGAEREVRIALQWLAFSERPLTLLELQEACIINFESPPYVDTAARSGLEGLIDLLGPLVQTDERPWLREGYTDYTDYGFYDNEWRNFQLGHVADLHLSLAHFSVKEYLTSDRIPSEFLHCVYLEAHIADCVLAQSCAVYLLEYFDSFDKTSTLQDLITFPLLWYAARYWYEHLSRTEHSNNTFNLRNMHLRLLEDKHRRKSWLSIVDPTTADPVRRWPCIYKPFQAPPRFTALYCASAVGLPNTVSFLISKGAEVNRRGGSYGSALQVASYYGFSSVVKVLLGAGAKATQDHSSDKGLALTLAASGGHNEVIIMLLEHGVDIELRNQCEPYSNALEAACSGGHMGTAELLPYKVSDINAIRHVKGVARGAGISLRSGKIRMTSSNVAVLQRACTGGNLQIVELLLDKGADINALGGRYGNALSHACIFGNIHVVQLLLAKGADIIAQGGKYHSALQAACARPFKDIKIVQELLNRGADINARGGVFGSALNAACSARSTEVVKLLLENHVDISLLPEVLVTISEDLADVLIQNCVRGVRYAWEKPSEGQISLTDEEGRAIYSNREWREQIPSAVIQSRKNSQERQEKEKRQS